LNNDTSRNNGDIDHLVVVDALYIDELTSLVDNPDVGTSNTTFGTTVDKSTASVGAMIRSMIFGVVYMGLPVDFTIDSDFGFRGVFLGQRT
jgi:hypothetical protein